MKCNVDENIFVLAGSLGKLWKKHRRTLPSEIRNSFAQLLLDFRLLFLPLHEFSDEENIQRSRYDIRGVMDLFVILAKRQQNSMTDSTSTHCVRGRRRLMLAPLISLPGNADLAAGPALLCDGGKSCGALPIVKNTFVELVNPCSFHSRAWSAPPDCSSDVKQTDIKIRFIPIRLELDGIDFLQLRASIESLDKLLIQNSRLEVAIPPSAVCLGCLSREIVEPSLANVAECCASLCRIRSALPSSCLNIGEVIYNLTFSFAKLHDVLSQVDNITPPYVVCDAYDGDCMEPMIFEDIVMGREEHLLCQPILDDRFQSPREKEWRSLGTTELVKLPTKCMIS